MILMVILTLSKFDNGDKMGRLRGGTNQGVGADLNAAAGRWQPLKR